MNIHLYKEKKQEYKNKYYMADNQSQKSKREILLERMRSKHPDLNFDDDEVLTGQISDDYDNYDKELGEIRGREQQFAETFAKDPRMSYFFSAWGAGKDPVVELIRLYGDDFMSALDDPERQEAIAQANKDFAERVAKEEDYEDKFVQNMDETLDVLNEMQQNEGISDEDIDAAMQFLLGIFNDAVIGKYTPETIRMALKALRHDDDVAAAAEEGEVKGRNARIEEKLRKMQRSDGTADLAGKNAATGEKYNPGLGGALNRYNGMQNIWERGGEKRIRR